MSLPTITLVTPTYNQADYLVETLDSVLAQDYKALEYLVIDDGSTDATPAVLARYADRVRYLHQDNAGQARTLNRAWSLASGKYLGYLSSDDLLLPAAVRRLVDVLEADSSIVCVFPNADLIDAQSKVIRRAVCRPFDLERAVVEQECYIGPGAVFRRSAFEAAGGWRPELRLAPDREFWIRLAEQGRIHFLDQDLARYRNHPQSTSWRQADEQTSREYLAVLDEYFARAKVPPRIAARRDEAYARAKLLMARNAFWRADFSRGWGLYKEACALHGPFASLGTKLMLARHSLSKPAKLLYMRFVTPLR